MARLERPSPAREGAVDLSHEGGEVERLVPSVFHFMQWRCQALHLAPRSVGEVDRAFAGGRGTFFWRGPPRAFFNTSESAHPACQRDMTSRLPRADGSARPIATRHR